MALRIAAAAAIEDDAAPAFFLLPRVCELNAKPLRAVREWLGDYEAFWGESLRSLKRYVEEDGR